jgi:hypothetical protein
MSSSFSASRNRYMELLYISTDQESLHPACEKFFGTGPL